MLSHDMHILLNVDAWEGRHNEMIDIQYLDSGGINNMKFSFVTCMSIPIPRAPKPSSLDLDAPELAFSADGSKFAVAMGHGRVSVWDIQSKVPLKTFMEVPNYDQPP